MMRPLAVVLAMLLAGPAAAQTVVYRHATLIDGTGAPARSAMSLRIEGERIAAVGPDANRRADCRPLTRDEMAEAP